MTQPAQRFSTHAQNLYKVIHQQSWLLLGMVMLMSGLDFLFSATGNVNSHPTNYTMTKNSLAGGVLAWISHWLFAKISLRHGGYHQRRQVVNNFYLAQVVKWVITMLGFALIFIYLSPLKPLWVFVGYFTMQIAQILLLYRYNHNRVK